MPRAVWTGGLSFGLVRIPVALYPATDPKDVRFHMVDRSTGARVRYRRVVELDDEPPTSTGEPGDDREVDRSAPRGLTSNADEMADHADAEGGGAPVGDEENPVVSRAAPTRREVEVAYEDLARGYDIDAERSVILERDEIERVRPRRSETIDIEDFVELGDIDPVYFEKTYYLGPRSGAEKPYALLQQALDRAGRVGVGRFVLRTKPHLVGIRPTDGVLALETLFFGDEVRDPSTIAGRLAGVSVAARELAMAEQLVEMLTTDWDPSRYSDEYRQELLALVASKTPVPFDEPEAPSADRPGIDQLMETLKQSVERAKRERAERDAPQTAKRARRRSAG
jgi:DNA end-binding protein Ku